MRLRDGLHRVQKRAEKTTHRGAELAKSAARSLESTIRHIKPHTQGQPASAHPDQQEEGIAPPVKTRTGIVSVNGRDVEKMCCTGGKRAG
jgi:hypothetical protein